MALQNELAVINAALRKLGANTISALSDTTKQAQVMNSLYEQAKQAVLRAHPWNFATRRIQLITYVAAQSITNITLSGSNPVRITKTSHGYASGDRVTFLSVGGTTELNGNYYNVTYVDANNFDLEGTDSTEFTAYTSGGTVRKVPAYDFTYLFALPSDCLRVLPLKRGYEYRIEGRFIATDETELELKYIKDIDLDTQEADSLFAEALACYLAWDACTAIVESNTSKDVFWGDYQKALKEARFVNASEGGHQQVIEANDWVDARTNFGQSAAYPRNG